MEKDKLFPLLIGGGAALILGFWAYKKFKHTEVKSLVDLARFKADTDNGLLQKFTNQGSIYLKLVERRKISRDSYIFKFEFPKEAKETEFGLHLGGHVIFSADLRTKMHPEGEMIYRKYTPISDLR